MLYKVFHQKNFTRGDNSILGNGMIAKISINSSKSELRIEKTAGRIIRKTEGINDIY